MRQQFGVRIPVGQSWPASDGGRNLPPFSWLRIHNRGTADVVYSTTGIAVNDASLYEEYVFAGQRRLRNFSRDRTIDLAGAPSLSPTSPGAELPHELHILNVGTAVAILWIELDDAPIVDMGSSDPGGAAQQVDVTDRWARLAGQIDIARIAGAPLANWVAAQDGNWVASALPVASLDLVWTGAGWDRIRTATIFKPLSAVGVAAEVAIWTPAAGMRFRLMGFLLAVSVAGNVTLRDGVAGGIVGVVPGLAGAPVLSPPMGNGLVSGAPNRALTATGPAASTLSGLVFGTEE